MLRLSSRNSTPITMTSAPSITWTGMRLLDGSLFMARLRMRCKTLLDKRFDDQFDAPGDDQERPAVAEGQAIHAFEDGEQPEADEHGPQAVGEIACGRIADHL